MYVHPISIDTSMINRPPTPTSMKRNCPKSGAPADFRVRVVDGSRNENESHVIRHRDERAECTENRAVEKLAMS